MAAEVPVINFIFQTVRRKKGRVKRYLPASRSSL
jgi:hypothetical protein